MIVVIIAIYLKTNSLRKPVVDELIDIVDEENNPTGIIKLKSEAHMMGLWHRTVHIWMYDSKGRFLLQLRAKNKDIYPNVWDISAAGHMAAGEDPKDAAIREIKEELGLTIDQDRLVLHSVQKHAATSGAFINNEFCYVYLLETDMDTGTMTLQKEEVNGAKLVDIDVLIEDIRNNPDRYTPHGGYWLKMLNAIRVARPHS